MSSMISPQGVVLATTMAVSGTIFLLVLCLQKSLPTTQFPINKGKKREEKKKMKKMKKRVQFAKDVHDAINSCSSYSSSSPATPTKVRKEQQRVALYNGILRDRGV
ncbi:hypothetical protein I3842_03G144200 [Carya illinoinensis]|uniref:Transmembrane protein n=1 Tax=Carya illinoinensis TaxID=32201 RepID=A0A922FGQ3_CARIL|nr:hypothetical protein I3842_03G144200 [Carya illinoinensis]